MNDMFTEDICVQLRWFGDKVNSPKLKRLDVAVGSRGLHGASPGERSLFSRLPAAPFTTYTGASGLL